MYVLTRDAVALCSQRLPPKSTLFGYFDLWNWDGTLDRIHHALYVKCRERHDREASPTACVIDTKRGKDAEKRGRQHRSERLCMRAKRSQGRSAISLSYVRPAAFMLCAIQPIFKIVTAGVLFSPLCSVCIHVLQSSLLMADTGPVFQKASAKSCRICKSKSSTLRSGKRVRASAATLGCRTPFAWLNRCRRLAKDFENLARNALAFLHLASIRLMLRKLCLS